MKTSKMNGFKVGKIKKNALDLYVNGQITKYLCKLIQDARFDSEEYALFLMDMCDDTMRVKGYYKRKPLAQYSTDNYIGAKLEDFMRGLYKTKRKE